MAQEVLIQVQVEEVEVPPQVQLPMELQLQPVQEQLLQLTEEAEDLEQAVPEEQELHPVAVVRVEMMMMEMMVVQAELERL